MKTLIKLAYCGAFAFNVMAMEGLEDSSAGYRTRMRIEQVDSALDSAVSLNDLDELGFLLSGGAGAIPSQVGVDRAFSWAASMKRGKIIELMLSYPTIRPTENCIVATYHIEMANRNESIAMLLEQAIFPVPITEHEGVADTISPTDSSLSLDKCVAVFQNIYEVLRKRGIPLISYEISDEVYGTRSVLEQAIMNIIPENQQERVAKAVLDCLDSNSVYQNQIRFAFTFIQKFYPDKQQQLLEGFVSEFSDGTGIKESIIRSLMNIDPTLDSFLIH